MSTTLRMYWAVGKCTPIWNNLRRETILHVTQTFTGAALKRKEHPAKDVSSAQTWWARYVSFVDTQLPQITLRERARQINRVFLRRGLTCSALTSLAIMTERDVYPPAPRPPTFALCKRLMPLLVLKIIPKSSRCFLLDRAHNKNRWGRTAGVLLCFGKLNLKPLSAADVFNSHLLMISALCT